MALFHKLFTRSAAPAANPPEPLSSRPMRDLLETLQVEVQKLRSGQRVREMEFQLATLQAEKQALLDQLAHSKRQASPPPDEEPTYFAVRGPTYWDRGDLVHLGTALVRSPRPQRLRDAEWRAVMRCAEERRRREIAEQKVEDLEEWARHLGQPWAKARSPASLPAGGSPDPG